MLQPKLPGKNQSFFLRALLSSLFLGNLLHAEPFDVSAPFQILEGKVVYPEEEFRSDWDYGCSDWRKRGVEISRVSIDSEKRDGLLRVFANARIYPEPGETLAELKESVLGHLKAGKAYPDWLLPGINENPEGGSYFVSVDKIKVQSLMHPTQFLLRGHYSFEVLFFKKTGISALFYRIDDRLPVKCQKEMGLKKSATELSRFTYRMQPRPDLLEYMMGELYVLPFEKFVELRFRVSAKPIDLVYQLMPEKLLKSQMEHRGRRIIQNFLDHRRESVVKLQKKAL